MEGEGPRVRRDPRQRPGLGHHRLRRGPLRDQGPVPDHPAQRQCAQQKVHQDLRREDHDAQGGPGVPEPLPLAQDGGHHQPRRRQHRVQAVERRQGREGGPGDAGEDLLRRTGVHRGSRLRDRAEARPEPEPVSLLLP